MSMVKYILSLSLLCSLASCSSSLPKNFAVNYYKKNEKTIEKVDALYNKINNARPIAIEFTDNEFKYVSFEMKTDSMKYIYEFRITDKRIRDTLLKYKYDTAAVMNLVLSMKQIKSNWINTLDYYVDNKKYIMTFMSIRPRVFDALFASKKYYVLTFFKQPQYYDEEGRLLDKRKLRRFRKISKETFWRIDDKVCYTIMNHFR